MFYEKLKVLCDKQGISVTALTQKLHIGQSNVTRWKTGTAPRPSTIKAVADFFGIDVSYFHDGVNVANADNNSIAVNGNNNFFAPSPLGEIETEIVRLCGLMDLKQKSELLIYANSLIDNK